MSFLLQKDVPLILTILIAAWTWIVSEHVKQVSNLQVLEFSIDESKMLFRNISQTKGINNIDIIITCDKGDDCFKINNGYVGKTEYVSPFLVIPSVSGTGDVKNASYKFSLTIGAAIRLILYTSESSNKLRFFVVNSQDFNHLRLVNSASFVAFYYTYYWQILLGSLAILTIVALLVAVVANWNTRAAITTQAPKQHDVRVWMKGNVPVSRDKIRW